MGIETSGNKRKMRFFMIISFLLLVTATSVSAQEAPVANFTSNVSEGVAPLDVQFNDTSLNATAWFWDFGDGNISTFQNPINTYSEAGNFTVNLTVSNEYGINSTNGTINVLEPVFPVANFTSNVSEGVAPLDVQFIDSSENATAWFWDFGDGKNSTIQNPTNTYFAAGNYTVNLTVSNQNGTNSTFGAINVSEPVLPVANFTSNVSEGVAPLDVQFNDTSLNATAWFWDFGDGKNSTVRNPINTYILAGNFTVNLTVSNENGTNSTTGTINVSEPVAPVLPVANFTSNVTNGSAPLTVQFNDTSLNATAWNWNFGDGNNSTARNPVHTYFTAGNFTVNLTVSNENGTNSTFGTINVSEPEAPILPIANFTSNVSEGSAPLTVQFNDSSLNAIAWNWDFGDGNNSTVRNPINIYSRAGNFTVNLTVSNANGTNSTTRTINVSEAEPGPAPILPVANFTSNVTNGSAPLTVQFNDSSLNATAWNWNFGDGNNSTVRNPINIYSRAGNFTVNLTVSNANGTNSTTGTINVSEPVPEPGPVLPVANFTSNVSEGVAPLDVQFNDSSLNATEWNWNFGDGNNSTVRNPINTYSRAGNFTVNLTVGNANGTNSTTGRINVSEPEPGPAPILPVANFTSNVTNGSAPLTVQFNDTSLNATAWNWNFGDGNNSTVRNPIHVYVDSGNFTVNLTVSNANGTNSTTRTINVSAPEPGPTPVLPVANFTSNVTNGSAPLTVQFNDTSLNATAWNWNFGDGNNSTVRNPVHTYFTAGNFTVNLTASNANGTNSTTRTINVSEPAPRPTPVLPVANFTSNVTNGSAPLTVQFNDTSLNATAWNWNFGDGNNSTVRNPIHVYVDSGNFTVNLTVSNANGTNSTTRMINVSEPEPGPAPILPVANFTSNVTNGSAPLTVQFNDTSLNATAWSWNFGDGNNSTVRNPIHVYVDSGNFTVNLTVSNANGTNSTTRMINVSEPEPGPAPILPVANFTSNVTNGSAPLTVQFNDSSLNATGWNWNFGDGNNSTVRNPINTYSRAGNFTVNLTVSNANGTNSTTRTINVSEPEPGPAPILPVANFTSNVTSGRAPLTVQFNDTSLNATAWNWNFGDGNNSTVRNPINIYSRAGNFTVNLTVSNANGTNSTTRMINVSEAEPGPAPILPVANFTSNVTSGYVPLSVQFTDLSKNATGWKWDFGDGKNSTAQNPVNTYSKAGNYTVNLTASNANGTNSTTGRINVLSPKPEPTPGPKPGPAPGPVQPPKPIVINNITIVNVINNTIITNINIENECGCVPGGIAVNPEGTIVYITNVYNNNVYVFNTVTNNIVATVNVGEYPAGIAVAGTNVYVTNFYSNTVSVINTVTNQVIATINVGECPTGIAVAGTKLYVTNVYSNTVSVIDITTNTVISTVDVGQYPGGIAVSPDGTNVYVTNSYSNTVSVINTITNNVTATVTVGDGPTGIAVAGTKLYVTNVYSNTVSVIDITTNTVIATIDVGICPSGIIASPDGTEVYVTNVYSNTVSVINTVTNNVTMTMSAESTLIASGQYVSSLPALEPATSAPPVMEGRGTFYNSTVSIINTTTNNITATVDVGNKHGGVAVSPDGTTVYATNITNNTVSVIDVATNNTTATIKVGNYPAGIAVNSNGTKVYVANIYSNNVSVIDTVTNSVTATVNAGSFPAGVAVNPNGTKVYVTNVNTNSVSVIDAITNNVTATVTVGMYPWGVAVSQDGAKVYVTNIYSNTVSVIDTATNKVIETINVGTWPWGIAVEGTKAYVANVYSSEVSVIDTATDNVTDTITVGNWPWGITVAGTNGYVAYSGRTVITVIDTAANNVTDRFSGGNPPIPFGESIGSLPALQPTIPISNLSTNSTCWCSSQAYCKV